MNPSIQEKYTSYDFKGGVGATSDSKQGSGKSALKSIERESPKDYLEDELTDSPHDYEELMEVTPTRQSTRTAGKTFKYFLCFPLSDVFQSENFNMPTIFPE